jgi:hypothetical protein
MPRGRSNETRVIAECGGDHADRFGQRRRTVTREMTPDRVQKQVAEPDPSPENDDLRHDQIREIGDTDYKGIDECLPHPCRSFIPLFDQVDDATTIGGQAREIGCGLQSGARREIFEARGVVGDQSDPVDHRVPDSER